MLSQQPAHLRVELEQAERALSDQDFDTCIRICDGVLKQDAINVPGHLMRGVASGQVGQLERAVRDLGYVLDRVPDHAVAAFYLGQALRRNRQYEAALVHLRGLLDDPAHRPGALFEMALALDALGRYATAVEYYKILLAEEPQQAAAAANLAVLLEKGNELEDALNWADRAIVLSPRNATAKLTRARVLRRRGEFAAAQSMLAKLLETDLGYTNRTIALNQLGQCLDRTGECDRAFACFAEANALQKANNPEAGVDDYGPYGLEVVRFLREWLRHNPPRDWTPTPSDAREPPVFLLGFPRSGTTLLDQALSAHPAIEVIEERELLHEVRRKWFWNERLHTLHQLGEADIADARKLYRHALAAARSDADARVVVDKLPLNSVYLQLIHRLFPEARILIARRDPRDVCLSCFIQTFQLVGAMPYFLELESTAAYYEAVMNLMTDAVDILPLATHELRYEDLVTDFEATLRQAVDFLGLPWDSAVMKYRNGVAGRAISTPSYQQVSEPLYTRSIGRWKNYRSHLEPCLDTLRPWVERFGYDAA